MDLVVLGLLNTFELSSHRNKRKGRALFRLSLESEKWWLRIPLGFVFASGQNLKYSA